MMDSQKFSVYTVQQTGEDHSCGAGWWVHQDGRLNHHVRTLAEVPAAIEILAAKRAEGIKLMAQEDTLANAAETKAAFWDTED